MLFGHLFFLGGDLAYRELSTAREERLGNGLGDWTAVATSFVSAS